MSKKTITYLEADELVSSDDRWWWETYAKVLVHFTPGRNRASERWTNGWYNRLWRGKQKWGTITRHEVGDDGLFRV